MSAMTSGEPSASELIRLGLIVLAIPPIMAIGLVLIARLLPSFERFALLLACGLGGFALTFSLFAFMPLAGNGDNAEFRVVNDTPWALAISSRYDEAELVPPGSSKRLRDYRGPGWIPGVIEDVEILAGPDRATRLFINHVSGEAIELVIAEAVVIQAGN